MSRGHLRVVPVPAKQRLVKAMVSLLRRRAPDDVSVRDVAKAAGVNHGLVHRHFGSKAGLVAAAVAELSAEVHRGSPDHAARRAATFAYFRAHPDLPRLVARACLDGPAELLAHAAPPPARLAEIVRPIRRALEQAGASELVDPHVVNALASAALLGWFLFRPLLKRGFGLPADADEQLEGLLARVDALLAAV
jgi:TetR/AcrR family transcriptional regulator, repressor for neighboring sulfatase